MLGSMLPNYYFQRCLRVVYVIQKSIDRMYYKNIFVDSSVLEWIFKPRVLVQQQVFFYMRIENNDPISYCNMLGILEFRYSHVPIINISKLKYALDNNDKVFIVLDNLADGRLIPNIQHNNIIG